jgi:ribosome-associated translation inhibitor RaiA
VLAAVEIGAISTWLAVVGVAVVAFLIWRGGGGAALGVLQTANDVLERRVNELEQQQKADQATIGELRARTDVTLALAPLHAEIQGHDLRAQARAERMLTVLDLIAKRLGPEADHAHE